MHVDYRGIVFFFWVVKETKNNWKTKIFSFGESSKKFWPFNFQFWIFSLEFSFLNFQFWIFNLELSVLNFQSWIFNREFSTLNYQCQMFKKIPPVKIDTSKNLKTRFFNWQKFSLSSIFWRSEVKMKFWNTPLTQHVKYININKQKNKSRYIPVIFLCILKLCFVFYYIYIFFILYL